MELNPLSNKNGSSDNFIIIYAKFIRKTKKLSFYYNSCQICEKETRDHHPVRLIVSVTYKPADAVLS